MVICIYVCMYVLSLRDDFCVHPLLLNKRMMCKKMSTDLFYLMHFVQIAV